MRRKANQDIAEGLAGGNVLRIVFVVDIRDTRDARGRVTNLELSVSQRLLSQGDVLRAGGQNRNEQEGTDAHRFFSGTTSVLLPAAFCNEPRVIWRCSKP